MMENTSDFQFCLPPSGVARRLRERYGVHRSTDCVRMWARLGKLPVLELENGHHLHRPCDVDAIGEQIASKSDHAA